jgi:hypothetical protein
VQEKTKGFKKVHHPGEAIYAFQTRMRRVK